MSVRFLPMLCSGAILFASTLGYVVVPMSYSRTLLTLVVLSAIALLLLFIFHREDCPWLKGQSAKCSTFFLLGFTVVHFQNYVDLILGNCLPDDSFLMVDSRLICKAAILSLIALSAFFCGYFLKQGKVLQTPVTPVFVPLSPLIIFSTILFPIWLYSVGQEYLSGGYGRNVENGVLSSYVSLIYEMAMYAIPMFHARNFRAERIRPTFFGFILSLGWYNAMLGAYAICVMLSGDRGPIISCGLFLFLSYLYASKFRITKKRFVLLALIAATGLTILGIARSFGPGYGFAQKISMALATEHHSESVLPQTAELAGSGRCLHLAMSTVPSAHPYLHGRFQLAQICAVIPTGSRWLILLGILPPQQRYAGSASFCTWIFQGDNPTYGDGTSVTADLYLDFGMPGVLVGMFIFGFLVRRIDVNMYQPRLISLCAMAFIFIYSAHAVYIGRSSMLFDLRQAVWLFILMFIYERNFGQKTLPRNYALTGRA